MADHKLIYFDFDGGRGEAIRIALHAAGVVFDDKRVSFPEFGEMRQDLPFNAVPVLEIDGVAVTQSNAICRYVGKMAGLYPEDDLQALYCDEVLDAVEDLTHHIVRTFFLEGEELRAAREKLVDGWLSVYLRGLAELLTRGGGEYFADNRLTVADLKAFVQIRSLASGNLDHVPTDIVQQLTPVLVAHQERIVADPLVAAYYATRS
jgi:glutathione S-transferase